MPIDNPILRDPLFWLVLDLAVIAFLVLDHRPYPLTLADILDHKFHHEDFILLCLLLLAYILWKILH